MNATILMDWQHYIFCLHIKWVFVFSAIQIDFALKL